MRTLLNFPFAANSPQGRGKCTAILFHLLSIQFCEKKSPPVSIMIKKFLTKLVRRRSAHDLAWKVKERTSQILTLNGCCLLLFLMSFVARRVQVEHAYTIFEQTNVYFVITCKERQHYCIIYY